MFAGYSQCQRAIRWYTTYITEMIKDISKAAVLPPLPANVNCPWNGQVNSCCGKISGIWQTTVSEKALAIPKFSQMSI